MYSGTDGVQMTADIFFGIVHYQRLRHMVSDKFQVRSQGPIDQVRIQLNITANGSLFNFKPCADIIMAFWCSVFYISSCKCASYYPFAVDLNLSAGFAC